MTIWTIILAAGAGSRFGGPKALAAWNASSLLSHAITLAPEAEHVIVVTGAHNLGTAFDTVAQIHNPLWRQGMGTSISTGIAYVKAQAADMALIVPVDQPFIRPDHLQALARQAAQEKKCILTRDGTVIGPPAAVPAPMFDGLAGIIGHGLKSVLPDFGLCEGQGMLRDIDTPDDLRRLTTEC